LGFRQARVTCQIALEPKLIKLIIIEGSKFPSQAAKGPDEAELRFDVVDDATEPNLLYKLEATLGFTLHLNQLVSCCEQISDQEIAANTRRGNVTNFVCGIETATHQVAAGPHMFRPWQGAVAKSITGFSLKTLQSALFDQIITELTETESGLIVAEARSREDGKHNIGEARPIAVAVLEAEIHHSASDE